MIQQLYPAYGELQPLNGTYLQLALHKKAQPNDVFIYANFISSLDGRIALLDAYTGESSVPKAIANARDWRLYQELAGQSDVMITSARYFRQLAQGKAQDLLPVGASPDFEDIRLWRAQQSLKPQPDIVVLSDSLDIPLQAIQCLPDRKIMVMTKDTAAQQKVEALRAYGVDVIQIKGGVTGLSVRDKLVELGYKSAYMIAGPKVHHTLLKDACLDELFLSSHMTLLGGSRFDTVLSDDMPAVGMQLKSLYLDGESSQMFMRYAYQKEQGVNHVRL